MSEEITQAVGAPLERLVGPHAPRHPTLAECEAAGRGPENYPGKPFEVGGLPATKEDRARFEAYMRGHCWDVGHYVDADECYDTTFVRCLWGVWRDRGALPTVWPNVRGNLPVEEGFAGLRRENGQRPE